MADEFISTTRHNLIDLLNENWQTLDVNIIVNAVTKCADFEKEINRRFKILHTKNPEELKNLLGYTGLSADEIKDKYKIIFNNK